MLITVLIWQLEGWDDFDKRRRAKHQKQLDFRVMGSTEFDEGADKSWIQFLDYKMAVVQDRLFPYRTSLLCE